MGSFVVISGLVSAALNFDLREFVYVVALNYLTYLQCLKYVR
jgi:hypothetical protein